MRRLQRFIIRLFSATAVCGFLIFASIQFVDRPVSTWINRNLTDTRFAWFTSSYDGHLLMIGPFSLMAGPAQAIGPLALIAFTILAVAAAAGWRLTNRDRIILVLSLSVFAALHINSQMKLMFGRTWPESWIGDNPSWIRDGTFGFWPFHGGRGWDSFPSGHTTVITTPATLLWMVWPEFRALWVAFVVVVAAGLLGGNYHFVSDIMAGIYLGVLVGLAIAALMLSPSDRLDWSVLRERPRQQKPSTNP